MGRDILKLLSTFINVNRRTVEAVSWLLVHVAPIGIFGINVPVVFLCALMYIVFSPIILIPLRVLCTEIVNRTT